MIYPQESPKRGQNFRDCDNLSPPPSQESNRTRQSKSKSSRCSNFGDNVQTDSSSNSDEFEQVIYPQESTKRGQRAATLLYEERVGSLHSHHDVFFSKTDLQDIFVHPPSSGISEAVFFGILMPTYRHRDIILWWLSSVTINMIVDEDDLQWW